MSKSLIGRKKEQAILQKVLQSDEAEMVAVIGRRRVGKTYLVQSVYKDRINFEVSGIQHAPRKEQLQNFTNQIKEFAPKDFKIDKPKNWLSAFFLLIDFLKLQTQEKKLVVFFDEIPWMATHKSGFLRGLSYFWNSWAVKQHIVVVICGSAASWMIKKVIRHKGGLHNRVTKRIHLKPFNLVETAAYLESKNIHFDHYQLIQLYMAMGGIPHYLKEIEGGKSAIQNIDQICFSEDGLLQDEFLSLYPALFDDAEQHIKIIRALSTKQKGLTRQAIIKATKLPDNGKTSTVLEELNQSGFISAYQPFGKKKKDALFRLTDEYSLFYLQFIEPNLLQGSDTWQRLSQTQAYKSWSGYAFESICLKHLSQIKKALGIAGVYTLATSFVYKGNDHEKGTQIDLVIDRNDHIINLLEIKFYNTEWTLTKATAANLRNKIRIFQEVTKTRKQIFLTVLTTFGLKHNKHSLGLVTDALDMGVLFEV